MFFSFRKEKAWYVGLGNMERVLLHNFQCLDTQEGFVSRLRPFLRSRMGEEIILIEHALNARITVLLVLSSFIVHRVIPGFLLPFCPSYTWGFMDILLQVSGRTRTVPGGLAFRCHFLLTVGLSSQSKQYNLLKSDNSDTKTTHLEYWFYIP